MKNWSPVSKVLVIAAAPVLGYLAVTSPNDAMLASASTGQGSEPVDTAQSEISERGGSSGLQMPELELRPAFLIDQQTRLPGIDSFRAMIDVPLFVPNRRPFVYEPAEIEPELNVVDDVATDNRLDVRLVGTVLKADQRVALVTSPKDGNLHVLREGDDLNGWHVGEIGAESILFDGYGEIVEFEILK